VSRAFRLRPPAPASTTLLAVFLLVMLALSCGVAFQAYDAARSHRATAEAVLRDYAGLAATEYGRIAREDLSRIFDVAFDEVPRRMRAGRMPGTQELLWELDDAARAIRCPCTALREPRLLLVGDLRDGRVLEVDDRSAQNDPSPGELVALVRDRVRGTPDGRYGVVVIEGPEVVDAAPAGIRGLLLYAVVADELDRPTQLYGVFLDPHALTELAWDWYDERPLLPPAIAGEAASDSTVRVELVTAAGLTLFTSHREGRPEPGGADTLETRFGGLAVRASIRPEAADRLVIGGLPSSRVPFSLGLLALTLMVGVAGLWEVRRHHNLARLREDFISSVSHELRTPLTQIRMLAELQVDGKLRTPEERARANRIVARESRRLTHLVENILQFSRSRARRAAPAAEGTVLAACVEEVVESFRPLSGADSASIEVDVPASLAVVGEREALRRILINLLDNALKYGPEGQTVRIAARPQDGMTRLTVEDEGPGVPEDSRALIWEAYRRLPRDLDSHRPGSGVGLAVVRTLVEGLGGRAWVERGTGGGARFVVELAAAAASETPSSDRPDPADQPSTVPSPPHPGATVGAYTTD